MRRLLNVFYVLLKHFIIICQLRFSSSSSPSDSQGSLIGRVLRIFNRTRLLGFFNGYFLGFVCCSVKRPSAERSIALAHARSPDHLCDLIALSYNTRFNYTTFACRRKIYNTYQLNRAYFAQKPLHMRLFRQHFTIQI